MREGFLSDNGNRLPGELQRAPGRPRSVRRSEPACEPGNGLHAVTDVGSGSDNGSSCYPAFPAREAKAGDQ